jgi:hypothetical protein
MKSSTSADAKIRECESVCDCTSMLPEAWRAARSLHVTNGDPPSPYSVMRAGMA